MKKGEVKLSDTNAKLVKIVYFEKKVADADQMAENALLQVVETKD